MFVLFLKGNCMNKLLLFLMLLSGAVLGQSRLGSTRSDIYAEFSDNNPEFGIDDDGTPYLTIVFNRSYVRYYFNARSVCYLVMIIPRSQGDLNYLVELYNKQYVIVSSTSWRMYTSEGGIATVDLMTSNDNVVFVWRVVE